MDHKGSGIHFDFLYKNQQVVLCGWQLITNNRISTNINPTTSIWFNLRDWTKIQGKVNQSKHHYFPKSLQSQKPPELSQNIKYSSQDKTHSIPNSRSLETSCMNCHTAILEILNMFIFSLVLVPTETLQQLWTFSWHS
jgi:hypothetical protein